ncbi:MAG: hypothetical protein GXY76_00240, partial [Chloroflexi bacterium]|nr:hypothetical protein [Chloroflexota bacterium]
MLERSGFRYLFFLYLADILVTVCSLALATWLRYELPWGLGLTPQGQLTPQVYVTVMFIWTAMFYRFSTYNTKYLLSGFDAIERAIASVLASWLILAGTLFMTNRGVSRLLLVYFLVLNLAGVTVARVLMRLFIRTLQSRGVSAIRVLIIGAGKVGQELAERLTSRKQLGLELVGYLDDSPAKVGNVIDGYPILGSLDQAAEVVRKQGVDEVVIALPLHAYKRMEQVVASIQKTSANIKVVPDLFAMTLAAAIPEELDGIPLVGIKGPVIPDHIRLLKRVMDIVISSAGLVVLSPL